MDKLVRIVFGMIAGAIAAAMLYALFFGTGTKRSDWFGGATPNNNLAQKVTDNGGTMQEDGVEVGNNQGYEGAWYYTCKAFEQPMSAYYYKFCYVPEVLNDLYVDNALGLTYSFSTSNMDTAINTVPADLSSNEIVDATSVTNANNVAADTVASYTTGWY